MVGAFPVDEAWRLWVVTYFLELLIGLSFGMSNRAVRWSPSRALVAAASASLAVVILLFTVQTDLVRALAAGVLVALLAGVAAGRLLSRKLRRPLLVAWVLAFPVVVVVVGGLGGGGAGPGGGWVFYKICLTGGGIRP
jgi:hypothetical protein